MELAMAAAPRALLPRSRLLVPKPILTSSLRCPPKQGLLRSSSNSREVISIRASFSEDITNLAVAEKKNEEELVQEEEEVKDEVSVVEEVEEEDPVVEEVEEEEPVAAEVKVEEVKQEEPVAAEVKVEEVKQEPVAAEVNVEEVKQEEPVAAEVKVEVVSSKEVSEGQNPVADFLSQLGIDLDSEDKSKLYIYGGGALAALWILSVVVSAVDSIPLLPKLMEVVGLGYSVWFTSRYLLFKENRDELFAKINEFKNQIF